MKTSQPTPMTLVAPQGSAVCYKANIGVASLKNAPDPIKVYRACPKKFTLGHCTIVVTVVIYYSLSSFSEISPIYHSLLR